MHRAINSNDYTKIVTIKSYFAYRLPHSKEAIYYSGRLAHIDTIENIPNNSIGLCSFNKKSIFALCDLAECDSADFEMHFNQLQNNPSSKDEYLSNFDGLMSQLKNGNIQKVVLSRIKEVEYNSNPIEIFENLNQTYQSTFNYILSSPNLGCWMGATPELLLESEGEKIKTVSLAGTVLQNEDWSEKERIEQDLVTNYIVSTLKDAGCLKVTKKGPFDIENGIVKHLKTEIEAQSPEDSTYLKTLMGLHPTPATCGLPTSEARNLIINSESHDRKLYTGFIVLNFENPTAFVNLRCMELSEKKAHLYLGGGLLENSDAEKEWEETERKSQTLGRFLR